MRPKWQARWALDVEPHNDNALPEHDLDRVHDLIWRLTDTSPLLRRRRGVTAPGAVVGMRSVAWHANVRRPQGAAGVPCGWAGLAAQERADVLADCAGYRPAGLRPARGAAAAAAAAWEDAVALTTPVGGLGCFADRLPEFLCQLGTATKASDFF